MSLKSKTASFRRLDWPARFLLLEATLVLSGVVVGLRLLRLKRLEKVLGRLMRKPTAPVELDADKIVRMVSIASRYVPGTSGCLPRALTAQMLLARRGYDSTVRIGVRKPGDELDAHAWLEIDGRVLIGESEEVYSPLLDIERRDS